MGVKADAREARRAAKQKKHLEKKARQAETPNTSKRVAEGAPIVPSKEVREPPLPLNKQQMEWSAQLEDRCGCWSWGPRDHGDAVWEEEVYAMLRMHEGKTWGRIEAEEVNSRGGRRKKKNVLFHITDLKVEVQERWAELKLEEFPDLFRFRTGGTKRIYGIRIDNVFYVLWYDPEKNLYEESPN